MCELSCDLNRRNTGGADEYTIEPGENGFKVTWNEIAMSIDCFERIHGAFPMYELPGIVESGSPYATCAAGPFGVIREWSGGDVANVRRAFLFESPVETIRVMAFDNAPGIAWQRVLKARDEIVHVDSLFERVRVNADSWLYPSDSVFCFHAENPRMYDRYCIGVLEDRTARGRAMKDEFDRTAGTFWHQSRHYRKEVGRSPYQPFPAIIYGNHESDTALVEGTLTQNRLYRHYDVLREDDDWRYVWTQAPKTVNAVVVDSGTELESEWNYIEFFPENGLNHPYSGFVAAMENMTQGFRGAGSQNRNHVVWGSYNCGVYVNFDQERILKTVDYIRENMPSVGWIQIDAGYDNWDYDRGGGTVGCGGIGTAYEDPPFSSEKFPGGMRAFTDQIRKRGLHPALWVGFYVGIGRKLYVDHPDWFVPYGTDLGCGILDVSRPEVRDFVCKAYEMFLDDWGFEGVKFDFWSYVFEEEAIPLPAGPVTGTEYRNWYLKSVRDMLPPHGYIQTGCDIAMGNPHMGLYADNYRYGKDIGSGCWDNVLMNARWCAFCVNTHTGHLFIPNSDAIGILPGLNETDTRTHINFCLVSRTLVEIAGWLHENRNHPLMPFIRKACCCPGNGEKVFFGDFDFTRTDKIPSVWYFESAHFADVTDSNALPVRTVALFNWSETESVAVEIDPVMLGLLPGGRYALKDFWSERVVSIDRGPFVLAPHESRLYSVFSQEMAPGIIDSNCRVSAVKVVGDRLCFEMLCAGENEVVLRGAPKTIMLEGVETKRNEIDGGLKLCFRAAGTQYVEVIY